MVLAQPFDRICVGDFGRRTRRGASLAVNYSFESQSLALGQGAETAIRELPGCDPRRVAPSQRVEGEPPQALSTGLLKWQHVSTDGLIVQYYAR